MAVYRQVHISFWQDPDVLELTPEQKYFYLYLMTNSKTTQCGCYEISKRVVQLETGYNGETVDKLIGFFVELGKVKYSSETREILLINWHKHNNSKSPRVKTCVEKEISQVKNSQFKKYCIDTLLNSMDTQPQKEEEKEEEKEETPKKQYAPLVNMTEDQHQKLIERFGKSDTNDRIEALSLYKQSKGKRYKCDYSTVLAWARRDEKEKPSQRVGKSLEDVKRQGGY